MLTAKKFVGKNFIYFLQQISDLKKENFSLKLRIFYMEERMMEQFSGDHDQLWKTVSSFPSFI